MPTASVEQSDTHAALKHLQMQRKQLEQQHARILQHRNEAQNQIKFLNSKLDTVCNQVEKIDEDIKRLKSVSCPFIVSEHALLRYIERVMKLDLAEIKKKILPPKAEEQARILGNGKFPADTHRVLIRDGVVITVITPDE